MKSHTVYLTFQLPARMAFENITPKIEEIVRESGVQEGLVLCNAMHITASVFINDDESGFACKTLKRWLEKLAPFEKPHSQTYAHNRTGEDNADAHLKRHDHGSGSRRGGYGWRKLDFRSVGADLLRRVRRQPAEASAGEGDRGVTP